MTLVQALDAEDPVPLLVDLLPRDPASDWSPEQVKLEELMFFYARIYGGGLSHAISAAADGSIPEALRLAKTYGDAAVVSWVADLERYFAGEVLFAPKSEREDWEAGYNDSPDDRFEALYTASHRLETSLGRAICQYVREHLSVFESAWPVSRGAA